MDNRLEGLTKFYQKAISSPLKGCCNVSEEAAKQIEREDLALRVAEAPQLAQGLASDARMVGLVLPLPIPDSSVDVLDPTLSADPGSSLAQELSWQSAMAELLALVRLEGQAAAELPTAGAGAANALEMLLANSTPELGLESGEQPAPAQSNGLRPVTPGFVETAFGNADDSALSLQDKDLFGLQSEATGPDYRSAGLGADAVRGLDIDLFGAEEGATLTSISKANVPIVDPGTIVPIDGGAGSAASISNSGTEPLENSAPGLVTLDKGAAVMELDLNAALKNADDANNLTIQGDGDDKLVLVGDWFLVSEDPVKSVSVYAYTDSPVSVVADNVEVVLA
jgi:hypothetical protein